ARGGGGGQRAEPALPVHTARLLVEAAQMARSRELVERPAPGHRRELEQHLAPDAPADPVGRLDGGRGEVAAAVERVPEHGPAERVDLGRVRLLRYELGVRVAHVAV